MKNKTIVGTILVVFILSGTILAQEKEQRIELPQLTLEEKWGKAESNLIYFIVCGITYAKSKGESTEDFGTHAGNIAAPSWKKGKGKGPAYLVRGISRNKQQFKNFQMEILSETETTIKARMKGFGNKYFIKRPDRGVSEDEYIRFFEKKWVAIADYLGLEYKQKVEGDWIIFTVTEKK